MNLLVRLKNTTFFILFLTLFSVSHAQSNQNFDKFYQQTVKLVDEEKFKNAFDQALNLENIGNQNNNNLQISKANYLLAFIFKKQENYLQTIKYATKAKEFAVLENDLEYTILSSELLSWAYVYIGFFDEANSLLIDIDSMINQYSGKEKHFLTFKKLYREASLLRRKNEKPKAILQVYFKALKEINQYNFSNIHHKNENYLSLYNNIGRNYKDINTDSSFVYFEKATKFKDSSDERGNADLDTNIAAYFVDKNENKKAIELLNKSIPTLIKSDHKFLTAESYKVLADAYKNDGNLEKGLEYNTLYLTYKDSLNLKRNQSVNEAVEYVKKIKHVEKIEESNPPYAYIIAGLIAIISLIAIIVLKKNKSN